MTYIRSHQLRYFVTVLFFSLFALSGQLFGQTAIGTCPTAPVDSMYAVEVTGFNPVVPYTIIIDGNVEIASTIISGTEYTSVTNFKYVDGTDSVLVEIVDATNPLDTIEIVVHEVFCIDIDDDGSYDFNGAVCDYITEGIDDRGTIISTAAPYTGTNVYVYVLTNEMDTALSINNTGYFTGLEDGTYDVYAFTFLNETDANSLISDITIGSTDMEDLMVSDPDLCYGFCGTAGEYTVECELTIVAADVDDQEICLEGDIDFNVDSEITGTQPANTTVEYEWLVDEGTGFVPTSDATADSILNLTSVALTDNGNEYHGIAILYVDGVEIDRDTSDNPGVLTVFDEATMAANMDTSVTTGSPIGVVFTDGSSTADSFVITAIDFPTGDPDFSPDGGNVSTGSTTNANFIASDSYTNNTGSPVTVTYTVTPYTSNDCDGDEVTITVIITPCPDVDNITETICSDDIVGVTLPSTDINGATIDSFLIASTATGATTGTFTSSQLSAIFNDTYNNVTASAVDIVYTITPYAYGCEGDDFTVTVTVDPEPLLSDVTETVCSDEGIGVPLSPAAYAGAVIDSFVVTADVGSGLTGTPTEGTLTSIDAIELDTFVNVTTDLDSVEYTITPYAGECAGESYVIKVRITNEPVGSDPTPLVCSDEALSVPLADQITNGSSGVTFSWVATANPNVTGETTSASTAGSITDVLTNTSGSAQTVIYTVTPTGSCIGEDFTVTVTVEPEPVFADGTEEVCSGEELDINLSDTQTETNPLTIDGYTYTVVSSDQTNVPAGTDRTDTLSTNITDTYVNTTSSAVTITYTVTPISADGCAGDDFDVVVTVNPEPIMATNLDATVCSNTNVGIILATASGSAVADSFNIISIDADGLSGAPGNSITGDKQLEDVIENDVWTNTRDSSVQVTYEVSPVSDDGCRGDTITITVTVDPEAIVDAGSLSYALCSNSDLTLAELGASISGSTTNGTWSTSGDGSFLDGDELAETSLSDAEIYRPGTGDIETGSVTFTLTVPASGTCPAYDDTVTITINNVSCSEFPWDGNE